MICYAMLLRQARYPIADSRLHLEPPPEPPLQPRPAARAALNLPPELQPAAGELLQLSEAVATWGEALHIAQHSMAWHGIAWHGMA